MRKSRFDVALVAALFASAALPGAAIADLAAIDTSYGRLLATYVTPRGVRYSAWRSSGDDRKAISQVVTAYAGTDASKLSPDERYALWINLYNATVLELVLEGNPSRSIKELSKGIVNPSEIFSRKLIAVGGRGFSLNELEKRLREESEDPRVHFALNCASRSCPPIRTEPFTAANLGPQLEAATRDYLASPGAVTVKTDGGKSTVVAVKIFDWYADDFKASGGPLAFIATYGPAAARAAIATGKAKLDFSDYDWALNTSN